MGEGIDLASDIIMVADLSGMGTAAKSALKGDFAGAGIAMAGSFIGVPGGGKGIALSEAKALVSSWSKGTFDTAGKSIRYHAGKHMGEVGAKDGWQYLRKAEAFRQNLKGATTKDLGGGVTRYYKKGRYLDLDADGKIVSFGKQ
jgi:hypothetical protein